MGELNILTYLADRLQKETFALPWKLEWHEQNDYIRLTFQFNIQKHAINLSEADLWQNQALDNTYEFFFTLYNADKMEVGFRDAFYNFAYDPKSGLTITQCNALIHYLKLLTHRVRAEWMDLAQMGTFNLSYDPKEYYQILQALEAKGMVNQQVLYFPTKEQET